MDDNNKLEDFFNQSMSHFQDSPTDAVWEGLQLRLDEERTFWERSREVIRKYFPYFLLLLGLGTYHVFAQSKLNALGEELKSVQAEKSALGILVENCGNKASDLLAKEKLQSAELLKNSASIFALEEKIKNISAPNTSVNSPKNTKKNPLYYKSLQNVSTENNFSNTTNPGKEFPKTVFKEKAKTKLQDVPDKAIFDFDFYPVAPLVSKRLNTISLGKEKQYFAPLRGTYSNASKFLQLIDPIGEMDRSRLKFGYEFKAFKTFVSNSKHFNFGQAHGLRMERLISKNLAITGAVHFMGQDYKISNDGKPIPVVDLLRYPGGSSFGEKVNKLDVESPYIDFPLGFKWSLKRMENGAAIYLNPTMVWQLYLPQTFTYTLLGDSKIERKNKQYFGYFGSANIQIGLEKSIRNNLIWQVGVWGETSFIPMGVEEQKITMFGLNTAILFQK